MTFCKDVAITSTPPAKPRLSTAEAKARRAARLQSIRLQIAIYRALNERDTTTPADIGAALDLPAAKAIVLLARKHLREGDLARLEAAAARVGVSE